MPPARGLEGALCTNMMGERAAAELLRELERGALSFVVRPRVDYEPGVQRLYAMLSPESHEHAFARRIAIGRNRMPREGVDPRDERVWAYVDRVASSVGDLYADLGERSYVTKTKGERHQPAAHAIAEGSYSIATHEEHTHLSYELDTYDASCDAFAILPSGSLIVAVFNPLAKWSRRAIQRYGGRLDDAHPFGEPSIFPDELQERFESKRFAPLAPAFLDHEGCELVLMSAHPGSQTRDVR